ncbi:MAG TPA: hypothetical protein VGF92_22455 [Stellaceae bacterium]|jgi:hypothetical protein
MSISHNRFGRRTAQQSDDPRTEPVLSFNPKRPAARGGQGEPAPAVSPKLQSGLRVDREDAKTFGISFGDDGPSIERHDDFDPQARRDKALDQRVPESERPLYHHLFDEQEKRGRGFGWIAALGSVAIVAIGAGYAWHNFMERPAPGNLLAPPGFASRGNTGYTTPQQPTTGTDQGADTASSTGSTGLTASPSTATPPAAANQPPTKDIAAVPEPKSLPAEPPPPPKKTISEAAANPSSLGPAANPAAPPAAKEQPAAAPAPVLTPPAPKHEAAKPDISKPRKEASITPPIPAPAPTRQNAAPQETPPPALTQPAAAPAVAPPPRSRRAQATEQPQQLTRDAPAASAPAQQQRQAQQQQQPDNLGPPPAAPDTVTVDGVNYVNGQEPHTLGTVVGAPQAASADGGMPPSASPMPQQAASTARPYMPADHDGGAPLPNDVIILPSGQMAVPDSQR